MQDVAALLRDFHAANPPDQRSFMPWDVLGKMLFPRLQHWERRRKAKMTVGILVVALGCGIWLAMRLYTHDIAHLTIRGH